MVDFSCDKREIAQAISRIASLVTEKPQGRHGVRPVGIRCDQGRLTLAIEDSVMTLLSHCSATVASPGTIYVSAKMFTDLVREMPSGEIKVRALDQWLEIHAGFCHLKIPLHQELSWPGLAEASGYLPVATLSSTDLGFLLEQVTPCLLQENPIRYTMVGKLHAVAPGTLRLVGTDGFRLAVADAAANVVGDRLREGITISRKGLTELARMCAEGFDQIHLSVDEEGAVMKAETPGGIASIRLTAVEFPDYRAVIPANDVLPSRVVVEASHLQVMIRRVLLTAADHKRVSLRLTREEICVFACNQGSSEGRESLYIESPEAEPVCFSVKGRHLLEVCVARNQGEMTFRYGGAQYPVVVGWGGGGDPRRATHVFMPTWGDE